MKALLVLFLSFVLSVTTKSCDVGNDISKADKEFLEMAGSAGIMEVEMGKLAKMHATRQNLKQFGEMMVEQHSDFNEDFHRLLKKIDVKVPEGMNEINEQMVNNLAKLRGAAFDSAYVLHMVEDHRFGVEKFTEALQIAKNQDLKKFLEKGLQIVTIHYKEALQLQQGKVGLPNNTN